MNLKKILSVLVAGTMAMSAMAFSVSAAGELPPYESTVVENRSVTGAQAITNFLGTPPTDKTIDIDFDFAMDFKPLQTPGEAAANEYAKWNADFEIVFNNDVTALLAGNYGSWGWIALYDANDSINYPSAADDRLTQEGFKFKAGEPVRLLKSAGYFATYEEVVAMVNCLECGVKLIDAPEDTTIKLDLNLHETYYDSTNSLVEVPNKAPVQVSTYSKGVTNVELRPVDDEPSKYDLYISAEDKGVIENFVSGEFTVDFTAKDTAGNDIDDADFDYDIISASPEETTISYINNDDGTRKYKVYLDEFYKQNNLEGKTPSWTADPNAKEFKLGTMVINSTANGTVELKDIVMNKHNGSKENLVLEMPTENKAVDVAFDTLDPTHDLTVNVTFNNKITDQDWEYNDMKVVVSGGDLNADLVYDLGLNGEVELAGDDTYTVLVPELTQGRTYNVAVVGEGYRTATYAVEMTEAKTLNFWNNVKDVAAEVEVGEATSEKNVTFLAGDIVKDNIINVYDLSAVVSYFGTVGLSASNNGEYVMYDLNRDGKIDSRDVAYVLVSWNK